MAASSSVHSTRQCVTVQCYGRRDGSDFSSAAWTCLERHQNADVSDPYPARGIGARIARARLSQSAVAVCAGLRFFARQPRGRIRRAENLARVLYAVPGRLRYFPVSGPKRLQGRRAGDRHRQCEHDSLPTSASNGSSAVRWRLLGADYCAEPRERDLSQWNYARLDELQRRSRNGSSDIRDGSRQRPDYYCRFYLLLSLSLHRRQIRFREFHVSVVAAEEADVHFGARMKAAGPELIALLFGADQF